MTHRDLAPIGVELLDDPGADPALVRESLRNIARSNRWFGGVAAARFGVERLLASRPGRCFTLLDVGTGAGDIPAALARRYARRGVELRTLGIERHPAAARLARARGLPVVLSDARTLPFASNAVDVVLLSQIAHHLGPGDIGALAREATRVARIGVVLADLERSPVAALGFRVASRALGFDPATRSDGITSLRRGFRGPELTLLLARAGITARVDRRPGWRLVATWTVGS